MICNRAYFLASVDILDRKSQTADADKMHPVDDDQVDVFQELCKSVQNFQAKPGRAEGMVAASTCSQFLVATAFVAEV